MTRGKRFLITLFLAVLLIAPCAAQAEPRRVVAGSKTVWVKDKSKPVRAALEARYRALTAALRRRDVQAVLAMLTQEAGAEGGQATLASRLRQTLPAALPPVVADYQLGTIELQDGRARVSVDWMFGYRQVLGGKERHVELQVGRDETWLLRTGRWWLSSLSAARRMSVRVDGRLEAQSAIFDGAFPF